MLKDSLILQNDGRVSEFIYPDIYLAKIERKKEKIATAEPTNI
jgi:hypothetical protein